MNPKEQDWEKKIRQDYAGIISEEQIQATIDYWREFIQETTAKAREEGYQQVVDKVRATAAEMTEIHKLWQEDPTNEEYATGAIEALEDLLTKLNEGGCVRCVAGICSEHMPWRDNGVPEAVYFPPKVKEEIEAVLNPRAGKNLKAFLWFQEAVERGKKMLFVGPEYVAMPTAQYKTLVQDSEAHGAQAKAKEIAEWARKERMGDGISYAALLTKLEE
jgi:hypothetical protein